MFRLLDRHIFKQLLSPFIFGLLGALIIIAFGPMNKAIKFLLQRKIPPAIILEWFVFRVPEDMQFIFPVATLMATLLGFAGLSKNGELTAMRAAGISLRRLLVPVVAFGALATFLTYQFLNAFVPPAMVRSQDLWVNHFRAALPPEYKQNFTLKGEGERLVSVGEVNLKNPVLRHVTVRDYPDSDTPVLTQISGTRAVWDPSVGRWILENARLENYDAVTGNLTTSFRERMALDLVEGPEVFQQQDRSPQELTPNQLLERIREIEARGMGNTRDLRVELYLKSSFPFCVFIFAILGATMGISNSRSGGFMGFGIALVLTFLYYVVMSLSASLGKSGMVDPFVAAWLHNVLFLGIATWQALRASNS